MPWLHRAQVARRLGRSIATVRRLEEEGTLLPRHGAGKVRLFDSVDVDRLVQQVATSGRVLADSFPAARRVTGATVDVGRSGRTRGPCRRCDTHDRGAKYRRLAARHRALREDVVVLVDQFTDVVNPKNRGVLRLIEHILKVLDADDTVAE
jgi:hypothetical protein